MIKFVCKNKEKIAIAKYALKDLNIPIEVCSSIECIEIQDDDSVVIAKESAKYASDLLKCSVVKIDTGLYIDALGGFPGPYSKYVEDRLTSEDILALLKGKENRNAKYKEVLAYCEYGKEPIVFVTYTYGKISHKVDGSEGYNFDYIFIPEGEIDTMANYSLDERVKKYSRANWQSLNYYLGEHND